LYIIKSNNFRKVDLQVFYFLIEKGSHFLRFSVIMALNHLYWRLRPVCVLSLNYVNLTIGQYAVLYTSSWKIIARER